MPKKHYWPNYQTLYPNAEISAVILNLLRRSDRKIKYSEVDIKVEQPEKRPAAKHGETPRYRPAREDSYNRLLENGASFYSEEPTPEECLLQNLYYEDLHRCLSCLSQEELTLIHSLFYQDMTEQALAKQMGISQPAVHKRKKKTLSKLKKMLNLELFGY